MNLLTTPLSHNGYYVMMLTQHLSITVREPFCSNHSQGDDDDDDDDDDDEFFFVSSVRPFVPYYCSRTALP